MSARRVARENWLPFVALHVPSSDRAIQLQRAAMPSVIDGRPVRAHTSLLREKIDAGSPYFIITEEEVTPTGTTLILAHNRTRW